MKRKAQKIAELQKDLLCWFEINKRTFPWRKKSMNSYQYVIAETLLQRTKAETIAKFYPGFIKRFPNWQSIDSTSQESIAEFLKPIGLYKQRSARMKKLAYEMVLLNGKFPKERSELEKLPFLGQYIVNAILLFIHKQSEPLLDVNMSRVLERIFEKRKLVDIRYDSFLQKLAYDFVNHEKAKELNWAILDFAAITCKSHNPSCKTCLFNSRCNYAKNLRSIMSTSSVR